MMQKRAGLLSYFILLLTMGVAVFQVGGIGSVRAFVPSCASKMAFSLSTSRIHRQIESLVVGRMAEENSEKTGDLYDDEVIEKPPALSNTMRERLLAEATTGLDSEKKQTNVLFYVMAAVAVLVALGGQGILF